MSPRPVWRRRFSRGLSLICIAAGATLALVPGAKAEAPIAVGYWSRALPFQADTVEGQSGSAAVRFAGMPRTAASAQQVPDTTLPTPVTTSPPPVSPPTIPPIVTTPDPSQPAPNASVPEGGLWVANDVSGAAAVSALRFQGDIGSARLRLLFAPGSTVVGPIVACPMLSSWTPEANGPWKNRPAHDCDRLAVTGSRTADGLGMQWDLPQGFSQFAERQLDIMLLPRPGSGDTFSLQFAAPTADALEIGARQVPPTTTTSVTTPNLGTSDSGFGSGPAFGSPDSFSPRFDGDFSSNNGFLPTNELTDLGATTDATSVGDTPTGRVVDALRSALFEDEPLPRYVAVGLLLAMGAGFFLYGGAPARAPQLLGGLGTGAIAPVATRPARNERGIGRFRRERAERPTKLT